jgi:NADH:ubiquinone oxidoreductase subunit 6 (subunit J)
MLVIMFAVFAAVSLSAAVMVVLAQSLLRSALWLILAFFGVAGIFILLEAEFLAVVQVLVYVGAIATLIIFAIMLSRNMMDPQEPRFNSQYGIVAGFAALLFVGLALVLMRITWPVAVDQVPADILQILGQDFVGQYVIPFEVASVLLVVAMIGSIIIARERE